MDLFDYIANQAKTVDDLKHRLQLEISSHLGRTENLTGDELAAKVNSLFEQKWDLLMDAWKIGDFARLMYEAEQYPEGLMRDMSAGSYAAALLRLFIYMHRYRIPGQSAPEEVLIRESWGSSFFTWLDKNDHRRTKDTLQRCFDWFTKAGWKQRHTDAGKILDEAKVCLRHYRMALTSVKQG